MKAKAARNILVTLLATLGVGAVFGGGALVVSPSGELLGMPLYLLKNSPFRNFLIPGIILFAVLGLAPLGLGVALVKKPKYKLAELFNCFADMYWAWTYTIYVAFAIIIWIQAEMIYLQAVHWLHTFYMFFAIIIIFVALLPQVRNLYKN